MEQYKDLVELSADIIYMSDREGNSTFMNNAGFKILEASPEEIIGQPWAKWVHHEDRERSFNTFLEMIEKEIDVFDFENRLVSKSGTVIHVLHNISVLRNEMGDVVGTQGIGRNITEIRKAQRELTEEKNKLEAIIEGMKDAYSIVDKNFKIIFQNSVSKILFGDHIGEYCYTIYDQMSQICEGCPVAMSFKDGQIHRAEKKTTVGNTLLYTEITASPIRDASGNITACTEIFRDITKVKLTEEALLESEKKYRNLIENPLIGVIRTNLKGDVLFVNEALVRIFEFESPEEAISHGNVLERYKARADREVLIERLMKKGKVDNFEIELLTKRQNTKHVLLSAILEGDVISGVVMDITERKRVEDALRISEKKYRDLYDNAPDMYYSLNEKGIIIDCNETTARMLGYQKEEILWRPLTEFLTHESKILFQRTFSELAQKKVYHNLEREFVRKDGTTFPVIIKVFAEFDEVGNLIRTKTTGRDITERKKVDDELLKVEKLESLGILAGGLAHDFNNLLTGIMGNINLAKMYINPEDKVFERLEKAENASLRAKDLTQKLLTFSKGGKPIRKTTSIKEIVQDACNFALSGSNVKCEFSIADDLWSVEIDVGQINQVVNNILLNALQSMPHGGIVKVSCENITIDKENILPLKEERHIKISIVDQGTGIPEKNIEKIFDPFFSTKEGGSGLGLAIAYSIVKKHDGHITVESEVGQGTTVTIYLPVSPKAITGNKGEDEATSIGVNKVLVMDDEEVVRDIAGEILSSLGYEVTLATNGEEAIQLYKEAYESRRPFNAVILDLTVPGGIGGRETIQRLREFDPLVKGIVSSGYSDDPIMANFQDYGFRNVVIKPYNVGELRERLREVIEQ